jgi:hypothetical protein
VNVNNAIMGTVTGDDDYQYNTQAIIEATANTGYHFVQWSDGNIDNPRTITVTQDTTITAIFEVNMYHVTVNVNNVIMGTVTGDDDYQYNTQAIIEATANEGYRFVQWSDGDIDNQRTITVTQDTTFTAEFEVIPVYHVTVNVNNPDMGTVTGEGEYEENSTATITATANTGYRFVQWNDGNTTNLRTITVTQDITFTAEFEPEVGISDIDASAVAVHPNPAVDNITVLLPENVHQAAFTLYDIQGNVLIHQSVGNGDAVSVDGLAAGIYVYNVATEKGSYKGKLEVKQ